MFNNVVCGICMCMCIYAFTCWVKKAKGWLYVVSKIDKTNQSIVF